MTNSISEVKNQANILKNYLKESNSAISHSSCLHAIAKINGYKDWNTMQANLLSKNEKSNSDIKTSISRNQFQIKDHALRELTSANSDVFDLLCYRIIFFILSHIDNNSACIPDAEIIKKSILNPYAKQDFEYSFKILIQSDFLIEKEGKFFVNPNWFCKGDSKTSQEFIKKFNKFIDNRIFENKIYAQKFLDSIQNKKFYMDLKFEFDHFGRDRLVASYGEQMLDYKSTMSEETLYYEQHCFSEYMRGEAEKLFKNTEFFESVNSQWISDDYYVMEYFIDLKNEKFKKSLDVLIKRLDI